MLFSPLVFSVKAVLPVAIRCVHGRLILSDCKRNTLRYHFMAVNLKFINPGILNIIVGKLSHWLQLALGNSAKDVDYILIDRASNRYKVCKVTSLRVFS